MYRVLWRRLDRLLNASERLGTSVSVSNISRTFGARRRGQDERRHGRWVSLLIILARSFRTHRVSADPAVQPLGHHRGAYRSASWDEQSPTALERQKAKIRVRTNQEALIHTFDSFLDRLKRNGIVLKAEEPKGSRQGAERAPSVSKSSSKSAFFVFGFGFFN